MASKGSTIPQNRWDTTGILRHASIQGGGDEFTVSSLRRGASTILWVEPWIWCLALLGLCVTLCLPYVTQPSLTAQPVVFIVTWIIVMVVGAMLKLARETSEEIIAVIPSLGVQIEQRNFMTSSKSFIPAEEIVSIVINEVFCRHSVRNYLVVRRSTALKTNSSCLADTSENKNLDVEHIPVFKHYTLPLTDLRRVYAVSRKMWHYQ